MDHRLEASSQRNKRCRSCVCKCAKILRELMMDPGGLTKPWRWQHLPLQACFTSLKLQKMPRPLVETMRKKLRSNCKTGCCHLLHSWSRSGLLKSHLEEQLHRRLRLRLRVVRPAPLGERCFGAGLCTSETASSQRA